MARPKDDMWTEDIVNSVEEAEDEEEEAQKNMQAQQNREAQAKEELEEQATVAVKANWRFKAVAVIAINADLIN